MGRQYTILSIFGTVAISLIFDIFDFLSDKVWISDPIISTILGSMLCGIAAGVTYRYNGNTGGLDVLAAIAKKLYAIEMGNAVLVLNSMILLVAALIFKLELAVLTFVGFYITAMVTNKVVIGLDQRKIAFIVSYHYEEICEAIIKHIGRGATILYGQGAYTGQEKKVVFVAVNLTQVGKLKELVSTVDPMAFMFINNASEVTGKGFTMPVNVAPPVPGVIAPSVKHHAPFGTPEEDKKE